MTRDRAGHSTAPQSWADVVAALRGAGLDPDAGELADALWLAQWYRPREAAAERESDAGPAETGVGVPEERTAVPARADRPASGTGPDREPAGSGSAGPPGTSRVALYPAGQDPPVSGGTDGSGAPAGPYGTGLPVGVPAASALPDLLALQRALRPLQRYRSAAPAVRHVLDERATAERSARSGGLVMPVFRAVPRAEASLQLVMDASSSMCVWDRLLHELQQVFGQLGAFRDVQVQFLHQGPDGRPAVSRRFEPGHAPLRSADQLSDPTGRRVTVLVSDCAGPLWRSGRAHRLLHRLARHGPLAVLQPLPQRMWSRTRLPVSYGTLRRGEGPSYATALHFTGDTAQAAPGALPVPVLPPAAGALAAWARLLSGTGAGQVPAAVGWLRADQPPAPAPRPRDPLPATEVVARFRRAASPGAAQLAVYLAAAPLCLPVMQLVQRTMLPGTGPAELSEVLLGGLLTRTDGESMAGGPWYEFVKGVQEVLLGPLGRDEALLVLKHCSAYVEQRFGKGGPNFPALAIAQLTGDRLADAVESVARLRTPPLPDGPGVRVPQPFAEVAAHVLERFIPLRSVSADAYEGPGGPASSEAVRRSQDLVRRFAADGMVQNLIDAVQLLRHATEGERHRGADAVLWSELAETLLRLWELQGGRALLREAHDAARTAAQSGAARARTALGRVLHREAAERRAAGDGRGALELLRRADREFTAVCATAGLEPWHALAITLERVRVLEEQWQLGGDSGLLQETVGMLEAFADAWPYDEAQPFGLPLAHGRALLRLSGTAADREQAAAYAQQAAASLTHATDAMAAEDAPAEARLWARLELADALLTLTGGALDRAGRLIEEMEEAAQGPDERANVWVRAARLAVRRFEADGDVRHLAEADRGYEAACRAVPRDREGYGDLIEEWGEALMRRAREPGGRAAVHRTVRVLRDCRMETAAGDPRLARRLLTLGRALMLRRTDDDRVDLREAEHLFGLAAQSAADPMVRAECFLELGGTHRLAHRRTRLDAQLEQAADAYRRAADAARAAQEDAADPAPAVRLCARAYHLRGEVYEDARRPRAARDAYRLALEEWRRLPDGGGPAAEETSRRIVDIGR
ncbi:SAV_2336 N-terminal domain-related protein [Streptomyces sp. NPDC042319]|uniref:SAV_2336 N-terminal domain-related protein n=1 Tax=Streptomyces sp. NPDC042319 TaxID=3154332 RepID=UPI0033EA835B